MKRIIIFAVVLITACSKTQHGPVSNTNSYYKNLNDFEVDYNHTLALDMNNDGVIDFDFASSMLHNPVDNSVQKLEFRAYTRLGSLFFSDNVTPRVLNENEKITSGDSDSYKWTRLNAFIVNKVYTPDPAVSYWEGAWKDKTNKYLGVKVKSGDKFYNGWIRVSVSLTQSKIIIHDYAFSKIPGAEINAGEAK